MRNIETFPSKHMYLYLLSVERKVAEVYHIMDRGRYLVWLKRIDFISIWRELLLSFSLEGVELSTGLKEYFFLENVCKLFMFFFFFLLVGLIAYISWPLNQLSQGHNCL